MDGAHLLGVQPGEHHLHRPHYPHELLQLGDLDPGEGFVPLHLIAKVQEWVVFVVERLNEDT